MSAEIRQKVLTHISGRIATGAELARLVGEHHKTVGKVLADMVREGLIDAEIDPAGFPIYSEAKNTQKPDRISLELEKPIQPERHRNKPFTPNRIAGAYEYRGNLVIKLHRSASAKSVTLSRKDFQMLAQIYGGL